MKFSAPAILTLGLCLSANGQTFPTDDPILPKIWAEGMDSSSLPALAHELLDVIGPRLVGTPHMTAAGQWAVTTMRSWNIDADTVHYGTWRGWERGISHIDLLKPRVRTLEGLVLAWSPGTRKGGMTAEVMILDDAPDSTEFRRWLPSVRGKFVLVSQPQPTGRPAKNWEEFGTKTAWDSMKALQERIRQDWDRRRKATGIRGDSLHIVLEKAGAAGLFVSDWTGGWGTHRVFGTQTEKIPVCALSLEDYNLLYRLVESGNRPVVRVESDSRFTGKAPAFNTIGRIPGHALKGQVVMLSAHFDSWDASSGATDNGTGSLIMLEAMRILRKHYPNPRRTIMVGLWGSEEQGLNGSRAFVKDNPGIVDSLHALFNQDNGTGRIVSMGASGLVDAGGHIARWFSRLPQDLTRDIRLSLPGMPASGGTDHASFAAAGAPGFGIGSLSWDYFSYTWHTNRDTYDKLVFSDLRHNAVLVASLVYLASEDMEFMPRVRRVMPRDSKGNANPWPAMEEPNRDGRIGGRRNAP